MARVAPQRDRETDSSDRGKTNSAHVGLHIGVELVAGVIGGALLGYGVDYLFGSYPFGLLSLLFLGSAAGLLNAYRYIQRLPVDPTDEPK